MEEHNYQIVTGYSLSMGVSSSGVSFGILFSVGNKGGIMNNQTKR